MRLLSIGVDGGGESKYARQGGMWMRVKKQVPDKGNAEGRFPNVRGDVLAVQYHDVRTMEE